MHIWVLKILEGCQLLRRLRINHIVLTERQGRAGGTAARTAVRVRERGRALDWPEVAARMMRRLAMSTTSLPLNFFSSSRTSRCCTL